MSGNPVETLLSDARLLPGAKAVLLLRVCLLAQSLKPELLQRHWKDLKALAHHLPEGNREAFEGLRATLEPAQASSLGGFAREIAEAVEAARKAKDRAAVLAALAACEQRIQARWWPFGKGPAWDAVVRAFVDTDRLQGFTRLHRLPRPVQTNLLIRENDRSTLGWREWDAARRDSADATRAAIEELLGRDQPKLDLSADAAEDLGERLRGRIYEGKPDDREAESKRDKARERYVALVKALAEPAPDAAEHLIEQYFDETQRTAFYDERWVSRFFALFRLVALWRSFPALEPKGLAYLGANAHKSLRSAVLAHWYGLQAKTAEDVESAWAALEPQLTDKAPGEQWFLLTLLRQGLPESAIALAQRSPRAEALLPALRRAWLFEHPETARAAIRPEEVAGDVIAEFLLKDRDGRVELLREKTDHGKRSLPEAMWKPPDVMDVIADLDSGGTSSKNRGVAVGSWYKKSESKESQFAVFVRINGYGQYLYESFDPILCATLVAWDDAHPREVAAVTDQMWGAVRSKVKPNVRFDLLRNDLLDRCETVLPAHPATYADFYHWIRKELVENAVTEQQGNMIYTFRLNERAPFLYALLGAQKVARVSAKRCDEILKDAIASLDTNADLMTAAAQLYAADKGLAGLEPPAKLKDRSLLGAWQLGVVQTALKDVLTLFAAEPQPEPAQV